MTRLTTSDIAALPQQLQEYDRTLHRSLGISLGELGCRAAGVESSCCCRTKGLRVAAVPISGGQGVIGQFSETLVAFAEYFGFTAEVTTGHDVVGITEAYQRTFDLMLLADDAMFSAINLKNGRVADNSTCTGKGFAHGLDRLAGGLTGEPVLVLGCGPVGRAAATALAELGAIVTVFDPEGARCAAVAAFLPPAHIQVAASLQQALDTHTLIVDATPVAGLIDAGAVSNASCIAAPGVPCGVTDEAARKLGGRLMFDPLQTGVATMLMDAAFAEP